MTRDPYTRELKKDYNGAMMQAFAELTAPEIDDIINYINSACP